MTTTVDYKNLDGAEFMAALGVDGYKWAEAFHQLNPDCNVADGVMLGWFCNALMAMHDHILGGPTVLPDGSAFFTAEIGNRVIPPSVQPDQRSPEPTEPRP